MTAKLNLVGDTQPLPPIVNMAPLKAALSEMLLNKNTPAQQELILLVDAILAYYEATDTVYAVLIDDLEDLNHLRDLMRD